VVPNSWPSVHIVHWWHKCSIRALCGLALSSIIIGWFANGCQSKWVTTNGRRIWSLYLCLVKVPSRKYKSLKRQTSRFHYGSKFLAVTITVFITILEQNR
jgi:hypothetical protein